MLVKPMVMGPLDVSTIRLWPMEGTPDDCTHADGHPDASDGACPPARLRGMAFWLLGRAARTANRVTQQRLQDVGMRRYFYGVLATLDEFGPAAQAEIGRRLGIDPSDMVAVLNDLEGEGLVTRTRNPSDRRRNRIELTGPGRKALIRFDDAIAAAQDEYLASLSGPEQTALIAALQRISAKQSTRQPSAAPGVPHRDR
jgi:DNA-binding MarR family transcriptional regulator